MQGSRALVLILVGSAACVASGCDAVSEAKATTFAADDVAPSTQDQHCGQTGSPDCPLQRWMKSTLQTYQRAGDHARLARTLNELAQHAPAGYPGWKAIAERGAQAASRNDDDALRQICKECHQNYRARYRKDSRAAAIWR
jgi:hypothetical protein